jgi:hypothetical protein
MPDFSREPSDYQPDPDRHFLWRKKERKVPGGAIEKCIRDGDVTGEGHGRNIKLRAEYGQISYWVVIDPDDMLAISCGECGLHNEV